MIIRISGWGQTGPYAQRPGFGTLIESVSGYAAINGFADREPVLPPMYLADGVAGGVLFRAVEPLAGIEAMRRSRDISISAPRDLRKLTSGPGRLAMLVRAAEPRHAYFRAEYRRVGFGPAPQAHAPVLVRVT